MRQSLLVAYQTYAHQTLNSWRTRPTWQIGVSVDVPFTLHPTRLDWNRSTRVTKRSEQWNQFGVIERRREHMEDALLSSVLHGAIPAINVDGIRNLAQTNSDVFFFGEWKQTVPIDIRKCAYDASHHPITHIVSCVYEQRTLYAKQIFLCLSFIPH